MLAITRKADYAMVALSELARSSATLSARKLAEVSGIPLPVMSGVLNLLVRHELVTSVRGAQGGYRLAKSADAIRLVDIIEAIDGPSKLTQCCSLVVHTDESGEACTLEKKCRIKGPMQGVHRGLQEFMSQIVLSQIAFGFVPVRIEANGSNNSVAAHDRNRTSESMGGLLSNTA
jgi:Rrf2 family protein